MQATTSPALHEQHPTIAPLQPRALREPAAAEYCGFSSSYLRNTRVADMRRQAKGEAIEGPRWINIGTAVRYLREDLDAWLQSRRIGGAA